ncbi:pyridoxine biosynthesis protein [Sporothrix eucalyptigena]|uniref:Pyridoxine biosynthesis protein n=1 Tax=Sporothrix eucalyptigena TaxID=1812306 RepID=A0ABP0CY20_9PEZI
MASFAAASRLSLRLAGRRWVQPSRGFNSTARLAVAQNLTMPALSPTMTEGSIAAWRVKEGDKYTAGDVLLEIETDKATMDVEAQDDGIVFKIVQPDGSKGVPVGTRIAVLAEADDDIASLEMPPDEAPVKSNSSSDSAPATSSSAPEPTTQAAPTPKAEAATPSQSSSSTKKKAPDAVKNRTLYPSVYMLIKQNGLDPAAVVGDMTPTGPGGRLLKGDVLAYLGKVSASVPESLESRFEHLSHLDLSNIKIKETPKPAAAAAVPAAAVPDAKAAAKAAAVAAASIKTSVSLPVSLAAVLDAQDKIQSSLGVFMPVSTFVARATEVANDELPRAGPAPAPSAEALFDAVVEPRSGSHSTTSTKFSRGSYRPQISALPTTAPAGALKTKKRAPVDVLDILSGKVKATTTARPASAARRQPPAVSTGINYFTVSVPKAEEKRAKVFLERLKVVLENEPGRLVL